MQLTLQADEARLLSEILTNRLAELRSEVTHTEKYALRQELKRDEEVIKGLLARLAEPSAATA